MQQQHPGRPSSSTAQHVINMAGMDPGLGLMGSIGGSVSIGGGSSSGHTVSPPTVPGGAMAANAAMMANAAGALPGAYRSTPSQQHRQSPLPPGGLSQQMADGGNLPQHAISPSLHSSHLPQYVGGGLSPPIASGSGGSNASGQLARSQSLGHAAYQQYQQHQQQQHQQQQQSGQQHRGSIAHHLPLSPTAADMYTAAAQRRDRSQQYSEGSASNAPANSFGSSPAKAHSASLLPTINTHIPSASLSSTSPYGSPSHRQSIPVDSTMRGPASPLSPSLNSAYNSPYVPTMATLQPGTTPSGGNRPTSMIDTNSAYSLSSYAGAHTISPVAGSSKRASVSNMQELEPSTGSGLPVQRTSQQYGSTYGDSLPLFSTNRPPSSPYMPISPSVQQAKLAAPPRSAAGGSYSPAVPAEQRMSVEPKQGLTEGTLPRKDRRGTISGHDAVTGRLQLGEFDAWERQQRAQRKRLDGFRRVRDLTDLKVNLEPAQQGKGRRADPSGGYVSPLKAMTAYLHHTYHLVNPAFFYELSFNPRRVLTKPSRPAHNDGHDNEDSDYILYVNDWLGSEESNRYLILDILGQGTFGQVVKCQNMKTREIVAVKVIKNKPAYFNQSMMEVTILEMLNGNWDPNDEHHILRLRDTFIHAKHLCLVFELLSSNLYELIKQNSFRGLSTSLVRVFTTQLLDALTVLHEARLIHCDLKPENILLKTLQTPSIKLVDFGSACHERQTVYTYIQSRFYRSPEVLLGLPYNAAIDMWSLGCIAVELFLGLPLFPGTSEYNQVCRIVEMLGLPPRWMLEQGKQTGEFFNAWTDEYGRRQFKLKGLDQYSKEHNVQEQPSKRYFQATTLQEIVKTYPMSRKSGKPADVQKEMTNRMSFIDFVSGLLNMDPNARWTPQQAKLHPFITGEKFTQPFQPPLAPASTIQRSSMRRVGSGSSGGGGGSGASEKHPFGGLVSESSNRPSGRTYQDAAAYNQHLAQQQAYNQAHQARQNQVNNPYARNEEQSSDKNTQAKAAAKQAQMAAHVQAHAHAQAQAAQMHSAAISPPYGQPASEQASSARAGSGFANRSRSNTLTRMEVIPPQLAKMGLDQPGHSMTPVLNREESLREWDRQQQAIRAGASGESQQQQASSSRSGKGRGKEYHNLDLLQQQAEQAHHAQWQQQQQQQQAASSMYVSHQPPVAAMSPSRHGSTTGNAQPFSVVVDGQQQSGVAGHVVAPPPAAYPNVGSRYSGSNGGVGAASSAGSVTGAAAGLAFDPYQPDITPLMPALQPTQYHTIGHSAVASPPNLSSHVRLGGAGSGVVAHSAGAMNRHSIAVPHMASPHQFAPASGASALPPSSSLAGLQGLYVNPNDASAIHANGITQQPPPAATTSSTGIRSDGFGGLSDLMFSTSPSNSQRFSVIASTNGPSSSTHAQPARSPIDLAAGGGLPQYQTNAGRRY